MKAYKFNQGLTDESKRFVVELHGCYHLVATPTIPQHLCFAGPTWVAKNCEEVPMDSFPWLYPHLPKIIKKELGILK